MDVPVVVLDIVEYMVLVEAMGVVECGVLLDCGRTTGLDETPDCEIQGASSLCLVYLFWSATLVDPDAKLTAVDIEVVGTWLVHMVDVEVDDTLLIADVEVVGTLLVIDVGVVSRRLVVDFRLGPTTTWVGDAKVSTP